MNQSASNQIKENGEKRGGRKEGNVLVRAQLLNLRHEHFEQTLDGLVGQVWEPRVELQQQKNARKVDAIQQTAKGL